MTVLKASPSRATYIVESIENTIDTVDDDSGADMTRKVFYSFAKRKIQNKTSRDEK